MDCNALLEVNQLGMAGPYEVPHQRAEGPLVARLQLEVGNIRPSHHPARRSHGARSRARRISSGLGARGLVWSRSTTGAR